MTPSPYTNWKIWGKLCWILGRKLIYPPGSNLTANLIETNGDVSEQTEITTVVGNFLAWDETGGHSTLQKNEIVGLSKILDTEQNFHSNLLKNDIRAIFGKDIKPSYSQITKDYLYCLYEGLSNLDPVVHTGQMITALWESLSSFSSVKKDNLSYFRTHVGGDDPAEPYHVQMTS